MNDFRPCGLPTAVGSLPHTNPVDACDLIMAALPDVPMWPQLPNRSQRENMYVQYFEQFPGARMEGDKVYVERDARLESDLQRLYEDYLGNATAAYGLGLETAAGLAEMRRRWASLSTPPKAIKGQITGPISGGLQVVDREVRPVLYDEVLADAMGKHLSLVARAQVEALAEAGERTIIFIDEPYLSAVGSAFVQIRPDQAVVLLSEVMDGLPGLKGIHCCGNTDWSLVLSTPLDVLSFDAYNYAETLALYAEDVKSFLGRDGIIAWGIVPTDPKTLANHDVESLTARLLEAMGMLAAKGVDRDQIFVASMVTPSCGLGSVSIDVAERALRLTGAVAGRIQAYMPHGVR